MQIHPIFVHFPVAFLTVYSLMEFIRLKKLSLKNYWFYAKAIILVVGFVGALVALQTGSIDRQNYPRGSPERQIISVHSSWAWASTYIYSIVVLLYAIAWIDKERLVHAEPSKKFWHALVKIETKILESWIIIFLAAAGLIAITIIGALGGVIVYGQNADPFVSFVYRLFF